MSGRRAHRADDEEHRAGDERHPTSDEVHRATDEVHRASDDEHRADDEEHAVEDPTIPPAPTDRCAAPPIRSLLFVPGHRERWVAPARASGADGVLFDLEDSVPAAELAGARRVVRRAVDRYGWQGPYLLARVAPPASPELGADLDAVVTPGLHAVVLPLVQGPEEVRRVDDRLSALESARGMPVGSVIIVPLVETALAARFSYEIAVASRRVEYMGAGTSRQGDIARALGYRWSAEGTETLTLRSWVLLNMRAAGLRFPITGLWGQVDDLDGLRRWVENARSLGYTGTMAIHPSHIPVINEVFTPTPDEVAHWERVLELTAARQAEGVGAFQLDGKMIDEADAKTARQNLALARQLLAGGRSSPTPPTASPTTPSTTPRTTPLAAAAAATPPRVGAVRVTEATRATGAMEGTIDLDGVRLAYTEEGGGDPSVLLLHGMACNRTQLAGQLRHLSPAHRTVSLDLRGHGDSDKPHGDYTTEVFVEDLRRVIRGLGLDRPVVVGHSRGGSLALALAVAHPDLVRALVLLDSGIRPPGGRRRDLAPFYASLGGPDHAERVREFVSGRLLEPTDGAEVIARVEATMSATPAHVFQAMGTGVLAFDSLAAARQCPVPGLLVLASRPSFLDADALATLPERWQVARVVGSGHFVQLVVPDQVNAMIDRFLSLLPAG